MTQHDELDRHPAISVKEILAWSFSLGFGRERAMARVYIL